MTSWREFLTLSHSFFFSWYLFFYIYFLCISGLFCYLFLLYSNCNCYCYILYSKFNLRGGGGGWYLFCRYLIYSLGTFVSDVLFYSLAFPGTFNFEVFSYSLDFPFIYIFTNPLHLKIFLISCFLICNILCWIFCLFLLYRFMDSLLSLYLFLTGRLFLWIIIVFSLFSIQIFLSICWKLLLFQWTFNGIPSINKAVTVKNWIWRHTVSG